MEDKMRIAYPARGHSAAMGYKYRARIESKIRRCGFLWTNKRKFYRYVIERHHMSWDDCMCGWWTQNRGIAEAEGSRWLDRIEAKPKGIYLTK